MKNGQYSRRREIQKIPTKYFIASGCGQSDITYHAGSYHMALQECGIENYNIMTYSSVLPKNCVEIDEKPKMVHGSVMDTIIARCDGNQGDQITAGIVIGDLVKKASREKIGSLVCEIGEKNEKEYVEKKLHLAIEALHKGSYQDEYDLDNVRTIIKSCQVVKKYGTVLVAIAFTEHEHVFSATDLEIKPFMGDKTDLRLAQYVFLPVPYDATATYNRGAAQGASYILDASNNMEDYDIETDSQPVLAGFHTMSAIVPGEDPQQMVDMVHDAASNIIQSNKFLCTIGGEPGVSIPLFKAISKKHKEFTVLQLDSHTDLRSSYNGTPFNEACVMKQALEYTPNIVQVGIRSISNGEKGKINYDKLFLAQDINSSTSDIWIDDVLAECTENVYLTLDADVFDPSIVSSATPEPDGLSYSQVLKLLKKLIQTKKLIGMDVNNFVPTLSTTAPEFTLAKMIYQIIAYREKYKK